MERRIAEWTLTPVHNGEGLQVLRYKIGQKYDAVGACYRLLALSLTYALCPVQLLHGAWLRCQLGALRWFSGCLASGVVMPTTLHSLSMDPAVPFSDVHLS